MSGNTDPREHEHLFISQLRKHPGFDAEVRLYVGGKLVSGTWPEQVVASIDAMIGAAHVRVDDETVERVYAEISHNLTPVIGRNRIHDRDGEPVESLRPHIEAAARAVLAALTGAES